MQYNKYISGQLESQEASAKLKQLAKRIDNKKLEVKKNT